MAASYGFLRYLFTKYSEAEYLSEVWSLISTALDFIFQNSIDDFKPVSYQTVYCQVYKGTCKGYKERLFRDLKQRITEHCHKCKLNLDEIMRKMIDDRSNLHMSVYVLQFADYLQQFHRAIEAIVALFHYLDVVYVKSKLRSSINRELLQLYKTIVIEPHIVHVFATLQILMREPDGLSIETGRQMLQTLLEYNPDLAAQHSDVFKRYCSSDDVLTETASNQNEMIITTTPRTGSKRSADELPSEEGLPSAKRTTNTIKPPLSAI